MDIKEEEKLIREAKRVRGGPNRPFGQLYAHYAPKVRGYFLARTNELSLAEDLTSRTFEKALHGLDSFQWQGVPFSSWLFTIARNTFFDHLRSERGKKKTSLEATAPVRSELPDQFEELVQREEYGFLEGAVLTLTEREREIVYLKFYEGQTNRTIAKATGLSETNVGTILYRTMRKLQKRLKS